MELNEGDIFFWSYPDTGHVSIFDRYHCKSRKAIVQNGMLIDTFWSSPSSEHRIDPDSVVLDFKGNLSTLEEIRAYEACYFRPEDIVDMRHSNQPRAKVYRRAEATRDVEVMRAEAARLTELCHAQIRRANSSLEWIERDLRLIDAGRSDEVLFPHIEG